MKITKTLAGVMSAAMLASLITIPSFAEGEKIEKLYASTKNVYLTLADDVSEDDVSVVDANGEEVDVKKAVWDDGVLRLEFSKELKLKKAEGVEQRQTDNFAVKVGDETKGFKVREIANEDFSDGTWNDTLDFYTVGASAATRAKIGILDETFYMQQRYVGYLILKDGLVNNLKDYTVSFDMENYYQHSMGILFNKTLKDQQMRYGKKTEGVDEIGWVYCVGGDNFIYRYIRTDREQTPVIMSSTQAANSGLKVAGTEHKPSTYKIAYDDTTGLSIDKTDETRTPAPVKFTVDKIGKTGVLALDDKVVDVYRGTNNADKGYFFIGANNSWNTGSWDNRGMSLDNIIVTVCDEVAVGDIKITDAKADSAGFAYTFDSDISRVEETNVKENVAVKLGDDDVSYDYEISGKALTIYPKGGVEADSEYSVTIKKTFGYELVLLGEDNVKTLSRASEEGVITFDDLSFADGKLELTFNHNLAKVKNIMDFVKLTNNGGDVEYSAQIDKEKIILSVEGGFAVGEEYTVTVLKDFGYEKVLLTEDASKTARLNIAEIKLSGINAGEKKVYLTFDADMEDIVDEDKIRENISVVDYLGKDMKYTSVISGNEITLNLTGEIVPDKVYDIIVKKGFGKEFVSETRAEIKKYFMLETVKTLDFSDDSEKASSFFEIDTMTENGSYKPVMTIKNNKAYFRLCRYGALFFSKQGIENMENYTISFDFERFNLSDGQDKWEYRIPMMFNRNVIDSSAYIDTSIRQEGYGWTIGWYKTVGTTTTYYDGHVRPWVVASVSGAKDYLRGMYGEESESVEIDSLKAKSGLKFDNDADDTTVTDTSDQSKKAKISVDKTGYSGTIFVDGVEISTVDSKAIAGDLSNTLGSEWVPQNKGYFVIGGASGGGAIALSNVNIYQCREVTEKGVEIIKEEIPDKLTESFDVGVSVRNYKQAPDNAKVIAAVYDENGKMIFAKQKDLGTLAAGEIKAHTFEFSGMSNAKRAELILINEATLIEDKDILNINIVNDTKTENLLRVNAKIKAQGASKEAVFMLLKDGVGYDWESISAEQGAIAVVKAGKGDESVSFTMNYVVPKDYTEGYVLNYLYSSDNTPVGTYKYISEDNIAENIKAGDINYEKFAEMAPAAGIDLSYIKNENQKAYFENQLKAFESTMTDVEKIREFAEQTQRKIEITSELKNSTSTYNEVNNLLEKNKDIIDLSEYNKLSDDKKIEVCTKFVGVDYERDGLEKFAEVFDTAVQNAANAKEPSGGSTTGGSHSGGGSSSGGIGGMTYIPSVNEAQKEMFSDIQNAEWAREAIEFLAKNGVLNGVGEDKFAPAESVTREQLAKIIVLAFNLYDETAEVDFTDTDKNSWAYKFIASAEKAGIMNGTGNGGFEPARAVTREEIAAVLYRTAEKAGIAFEAEKTDFADFEAISAYAREAVGVMAGERIINGFPDNTFRPKAQATRAQAAQLIYSVIDLMK